jgi:hypothetical protein
LRPLKSIDGGGAGRHSKNEMRTTSILASIILASLFLAESVFSESPVSSPEGLRLFRRMQEALGGADRIAAVRDFEQQVRTRVNRRLKQIDLAAKPLDLRPVLSSHSKNRR